MSSCSGIGLSSSSIFSGGLCSGNTRRPSMFTAKYRLREERKKVLKLSLNKVRRIEDPESFLRRSVLINNTVKRLQREVREEKMMRNGGYSSSSKLSSMHSFRKSFVTSRLQELVHSEDDLIDDTSSLSSSVYSSTNSPLPINSRKRPLTDDSDSDVEEVLSQIYIPPTPCIITTIDEDESRVSSSFPSCLSGEVKKARLSMTTTLEESRGLLDETTFPLTTPMTPPSTDEVDIGVSDLEIDVDVVGDGDESNKIWSTESSSTIQNPLDEVMAEFRLDFHLTNQNSTSDEIIMEDTTQLRHHSDLSPSCEETKENTCGSICSPLSSTTCCPSALLSIPLTDLPVHQQKSPSPVNNSSNGNTGLVSPETTNSSSVEKQFSISSCGHSSIFGELQSVVFHNLIASLET